MKTSRGGAIYVICITVTSCITRSALFWSSVTSRSLRLYQRLVFSPVIYSRRRLCALPRATGLQHRRFRCCYMRIDIRACVRTCVHREISCRVRRRPYVKTRRVYVYAVIDCSPKPTFHGLLFIYGPTRYISNRRPNIRNVGIVRGFIFFAGMHFVIAIDIFCNKCN